MDSFPALIVRPTGDFAAEEEAGGVALGGVVVARAAQFGGKVDRSFPGNGFVVEQAIDEVAGPTDVWFEEDDAAARGEDAAGFAQEGVGRTEVMPDIEEHEVREGFVGEGKFIAVADDVEPGIGKKVGGDGVGQVGLEVADAGTDFDDASGNLGVDQFEDALVEAGVDFLEERFRVPGAQVFFDLELMLRERGHTFSLLRRRELADRL